VFVVLKVTEVKLLCYSQKFYVKITTAFHFTAKFVCLMKICIIMVVVSGVLL
jgi:hypothetical protein